MLVLQIIEVNWTKDSRGAPGAVARNAIPEALNIPEIGSAIFRLHEARFNEWDGFKPLETTEARDSIGSHGVLGFRSSRDEMEIVFGYRHELIGAPNRGAYEQSLFTLESGEWGRFLVNGRLATETTSFYRKIVANIGYFDKADRSVFLSSKPKYTVDKTDILL